MKVAIGNSSINGQCFIDNIIVRFGVDNHGLHQNKITGKRQTLEFVKAIHDHNWLHTWICGTPLTNWKMYVFSLHVATRETSYPAFLPGTPYATSYHHQGISSLPLDTLHLAHVSGDYW